MINANELRIGNWVKLNNPESRPREVGNYAKVFAIDSEHSYKEYKGTATISPFREFNFYGQFLCFIDPIPLTPEILEKCGFRKSLNGYCYGMITNDGKNRFSIFTDGTFKLGTQDLSVNIHHLHQLQNLYFALTNAELNYTP